MSGSGAGEMALTSSKAVVFTKFDMHVYTSELTSSELEATVADYLIPMDLHPRLPPPGMTMDKLPSRVHVSQLVPMGVYRVILFEILYLSMDVWPTVSLFRVFYKLCKQGYWFSFENKTGRDAMPWRHGDTDLHDDFSSNFNQDDVERLSEFLVPLRRHPRHLLYVCGLTTSCRHPGLTYSIRDQDKNVISMDTFLKLPTWTGTIVSKGYPILEDQRPKPRVTPSLLECSKILNLTAFQRSVEMPNTKIAVVREMKERQSLSRAEAKRVGVGHAGGSRKKRKVQKKNEPAQSRSEETLSASPIHQAHPEAAKKPATIIPPEVSQGDRMSKRELRNDLRICTYRAYRELVNHVATSAEDEFLGTLSNAEVLIHAYQTLRQSVVARGELLKRHEQLNHDYIDIWNRRDTDLSELERLRSGLRKANQDKDEITKKFTLFDNAHSKCTSREKELLDMSLSLPWSNDYTSVEYRKSLVASVQLCFTTGLLGMLALGRTEEEKIANSCDLPLSELRSVHLDAPSPEGVTLGGAAESTVQQPPSTSLKTTSDIPFVPTN
nr:hypothetical protein [Tanacetum cinerariifolium]